MASVRPNQATSGLCHLHVVALVAGYDLKSILVGVRHHRRQKTAIIEGKKSVFPKLSGVIAAGRSYFRPPDRRINIHQKEDYRSGHSPSTIVAEKAVVGAPKAAVAPPA